MTAEVPRPRLGALTWEAVRIAVSQPAPSIVLALLVAGACTLILATVGQTAAAEAEVLAQIDETGTRSLVLIDTEGRAELRPDAVARIAAVSSVEWAVGFGPATDVTNPRIPGSRPVAARTVHGQLPPSPYLALSPWRQQPGTALVGADALTTLGLTIPAGGAEGFGGDLAIVGWLQAEEPLAFLNRGLIAAPGPDDSDPTIRSIHILADRPEDVAALAASVRSLAGASDPTSLAVETSETLALVRTAVAGELGNYGRQLVVMVLGSAVVLVGLTVYGTVTTRRRDFGRRRALGAGRMTLIGLVVTQTTMVATLGGTVGAAVGTFVAYRLSGSTPRVSFILAVATLCVLAAAAASVAPAVVAARRDPVRILRVP